ncbi:MAG: hypothetical protein QXL17_07380 [Candidatus Thermoplasmatota archaeon]
MPTKENAEILKRILKTLIEKIGRRTSEGFAVIILETVLKHLQEKYPFIAYVSVEKKLYSEGFDAVKIQPEINQIPSHDFFLFVKELIEMTVLYLEKNADFYFIKEFRESISDIADTDFAEFGINLNFMQHEYIVERKEELKIKKHEILEHVIKALINIINRVYPEQEALQTMISILQKNQQKFDFLQAVTIGQTPDYEGFYTIQVGPDVNGVRSAMFIDAVTTLIEGVCRTIRWKDDVSFVDMLTIELGDEHVLNLKNLGLNFKHIETLIVRMEFEVIIKKTFATIVEILRNQYSVDFIYNALLKLQEKLAAEHELFSYISINPTFVVKEADAIVVKPDVNMLEPYKVGRALRDMIKYTCLWYLKGDFSFIEEFKQKLGEEYLYEIEQIGVNLHFLELKFATKP